ncbi:MAG: shikimate dehydrogenase [Ruminococcaceae bacterium]|nr:shikimate dehydrogenase [Oscillospiraceae bacterium]
MEYGCIGEKLKHSFSKEIHAKLFSYNYEICEIERQDLDSFMKKHDFKAINVTIPYKTDVIPYLDYIDDMAEKIGAVNTIVNKNGKLYGYNTDFSGLSALILKNGIELAQKKVLILGSGGTSKTAKAVCESLGAGVILRVSREAKDGFITYEDAKETHNDADVIINTTPVGMYPNIDGAAVNISNFKKLSGVVDAVYNPLCTRLVLDAKSQGIKATGGLYMLVAQAVFAAEKFTDSKIPTEKIDEVYKEILLSKKNIVLVGMPSSGKSTIGSALAEKLGMNFIDTDTLVVDMEKRSIPEIFQSNGEQHFRSLESKAVLEAAKNSNTVIATGGGVILNPKNIERLRQNGKIYFLDRPINDLLVTDDRPLSNDIEKLKKLYDERYDLYRKAADVIVKCDFDIEENIKAIKEDFLKCDY